MSNEVLISYLESDVSECESTEIFYMACRYDNCNIIKNYIATKKINPRANGFYLLKHAIEKKCVKIVDEILNSDFFLDIPNDTKVAVKMAAKMGDSGFAMYMLS